MLSQIYSFGLMGLDGYVVTVEADLSNGLPAFDIVGLPDASVREAKERVTTAARSMGLAVPPCRKTVNLAPEESKKEGFQWKKRI